MKIEVAFVGSVSCEFTAEEEFELLDTAWFDSEWTDDSACACLACSWTGTVREAHSSESKAVATKTKSPVPQRPSAPVTPSVPMTEEELLEIKRELENSHGPPQWQRHVRNLVGELERVNAMLETFVDLNRNPKSNSADDDTMVG